MNNKAKEIYKSWTKNNQLNYSVRTGVGKTELNIFDMIPLRKPSKRFYIEGLNKIRNSKHFK